MKQRRSKGFIVGLLVTLIAAVLTFSIFWYIKNGYFSLTPSQVNPCQFSNSSLISPATIVVSSRGIAPTTSVICVGQQITVVNQDSVAHTLTAASKDFSSDQLSNLDYIDAGQSATATFYSPGTITYLDSLHPYYPATIEIR